MTVSLLVRRTLLAVLFVSSAYFVSGIADLRPAVAVDEGCPACTASSCPTNAQDMKITNDTTIVPFCYENDHIPPSHCRSVVATKWTYYIPPANPFEDGDAGVCWKRACGTPGTTSTDTCTTPTS